MATGNVQMQGAAYVMVEGLHFRSAGFVKMQDTDHGRISRFRIQRQQTGGEIDWVQVTGTSKYCRVDHNDIGPLSAVGQHDPARRRRARRSSSTPASTTTTSTTSPTAAATAGSSSAPG